MLQRKRSGGKIFQIIEFVADFKFADPSNFKPFNSSSKSFLNSPHLRKIPVQIRERNRVTWVKIGNSTLNFSFSFSISSISFLVVECWPRAEASRISLDRSAQSNYPNSLIEAFFELKRVKRRLNKSEANFSISRLRDRVSQPGTLYIGVGRRGRIGINFASDCLWRTHRGDFMGL